MLVEKYRPNKVKEIIGNRDQINKIIEWVFDWERNKKRRPLMITGPSGVGKTSIAHAIKNEFKWDIVEMNASDFRDKEKVEKIIGSASVNASLFASRKLILIDDIDQTFSIDRGGISAVARILKYSNQPIILTALNLWDKKILPLRSLCIPITLKRVNWQAIASLLRNIANKEGYRISETDLVTIAKNAKGDVRAALNDLEAKNPKSFRDRKMEIFEIMKTIFLTMDYNNVRKVSFNSNIDHNTLKMWIDENIPTVYSGHVLVNAFDYLSRADVFDGRIYRRQYWTMLRYSNDLMLAGVSLSKVHPSFRFIKYSYPSYIKKMGRSKTDRSIEKSIAIKMKSILHGSIRKKRREIFLVGLLIRKNKKISEILKLDDKEIKYLNKLVKDT